MNTAGGSAIQGATATADDLPWSVWVKPGDRVYCSHMTSEPCTLIESLARADLSIPIMIDLGVPFSTSAAALNRHTVLQVMGGIGYARKLRETHTTTIERASYWHQVQAYSLGERRADIVLVSLARGPDERLYLGAAHGAAIDTARRARIVIAEINLQAPAIAGGLWPEDIALPAWIEVDRPIAQTRTNTPDDVESRIAAYLAELVPNSACLQVGIGSLPSAVLNQLRHHHGLGIHTGMLTEALYALVESGAVNNGAKPPGMRNASIGCAYGGSVDWYRRVAADPAVELAHPGQTHGLKALATIARFTAINSAIEVDLFGRVNSETVRAVDGCQRYIGGVGGLPDFARGALASAGGCSVIALPARTRTGPQGRSRIVPRLVGDSTLDADLADVVVTENGVAHLRGASPTQRVARLIAIADQSDRAGLAGEANRLGLTR